MPTRFDRVIYGNVKLAPGDRNTSAIDASRNLVVDDEAVAVARPGRHLLATRLQVLSGFAPLNCLIVPVAAVENSDSTPVFLIPK